MMSLQLYLNTRIEQGNAVTEFCKNANVLFEVVRSAYKAAVSHLVFRRTRERRLVFRVFHVAGRCDDDVVLFASL